MYFRQTADVVTELAEEGFPLCWDTLRIRIILSGIQLEEARGRIGNRRVYVIIHWVGFLQQKLDILMKFPLNVSLRVTQVPNISVKIRTKSTLVPRQGTREFFTQYFLHFAL